jgi:hypothetical protein
MTMSEYAQPPAGSASATAIAHRTPAPICRSALRQARPEERRDNGEMDKEFIVSLVALAKG